MSAFEYVSIMVSVTGLVVAVVYPVIAFWIGTKVYKTLQDKTDKLQDRTDKLEKDFAGLSSSISKNPSFQDTSKKPTLEIESHKRGIQNS